MLSDHLSWTRHAFSSAPRPLMPPPQTPELLARAREYRILVNADPAVLALHVEFDELCGHVLRLEAQAGVLEALLPGGAWAARRKGWSHHGVLADGRDFGNWGYAVILRHLFACGLVDHDACCDILLGDVVEALLHLATQARRGEDAATAAERRLPEYAWLFDRLCLVLEAMKKWFVEMHFWESSRRMAVILC